MSLGHAIGLANSQPRKRLRREGLLRRSSTTPAFVAQSSVAPNASARALKSCRKSSYRLGPTACSTVVPLPRLRRTARARYRTAARREHQEGPGRERPADPDAHRAARPTLRLGVAATHVLWPPVPRAGANGCSPEISGTSAEGWSWPKEDGTGSWCRAAPVHKGSRRRRPGAPRLCRQNAPPVDGRAPCCAMNAARAGGESQQGQELVPPSPRGALPST